MKALKLKDVNLYKRFTFNPEHDKKIAKWFRLVIPAVLLAGVMTGAIVFLQYQVKNLQEQIDEQNRIIDSAESYNDSELYRANKTMYESLTSQLELYKLYVRSYPRCDTEFIDAVFSCTKQGITIQNLNFDKGVLSFSAESDNVNDIPEYIAKLRNTERFISVVYNGYSANESETSTSFGFSVTCTLNETVKTSEFDKYSVQDLAIDGGEGLDAYDPNAELAEQAENEAN